MWRCLFTGLIFSVLSSNTGFADDLFLERFALASDREAVLKELIPGTQEYYYFHCLHYQNTQQFQRVEDLLQKWIALHNSGNLINEIQYRQALLTYERNPQKTLDFIRDHLGLTFNHQKDVPNSEPDLPETLDQNLIARERLLQQAYVDHTNLSGVTTQSFPWLIGTELNPERRRHLLSQLDRPDFPSLAKMLVDDLNSENSGGFGSLGIHQRLMLDQLQECVQLMPTLRDQSAFVNVWLQRLAPDNDVNSVQDAIEREAHLTRLWEFVKSLSSAQNSLKAHVLYQRLDFNRSKNDYDKALFLEYIKLPRHAPYMNGTYMQQPLSQQYPADLAANYSSFTRCPVIGNDEPLIRDYLHRLLTEADNTGEFQPYINDTYLNQRFAETKIVNGLGNPEQWYALLPPADYQILRDRVDLDFSPTNKTQFTVDEAVGLDVFIKNVPTLIVKVFEINTANFYRDFDAEINTDIDLDGLVANHEETLIYDEAPLRRVRRHFEFPQLSKRGTYVIDFIGNGHSSRALIRKGQLRFVVSTTSAGQQFKIFNELGKPAKLPTATLGGQKYDADKNQNVIVPYSTNPGRRSIIISSGDLSTLGSFQHDAENYELRAGILVDRQSLLRLRTAKVIVRPQLLLNGSPVSLRLLKNVRLTLTSINLDEVSTTATVSDFGLTEDREAEHEFLVPDRLSSMTFTLTAQVRNQSQAKDVDLSVGDTVAVNASDRTEKIEFAHLSQVESRYIVDVRGRTGEPLKHRPVYLTLRHRDFTREVVVSLRSNAKGKIDLGLLAGVISVKAQLANGVAQLWLLGTDQIEQFRVVHVASGSQVRIPCLLANGIPSRTDISLCELRGSECFADRFDAIRIHDGFAEINDLAAGDYSFLLRDSGQQILIRITDGTQLDELVIGKARILEERSLLPMNISSIKSMDGQLKIKVENATKLARVHIFANLFLPAVSHFEKLTRILNPGVLVQAQIDPLSAYAQGRKIGDEYRYILDRRLAEKYPGNMNARPEMLLNPWAVRATETERRDAAAGDEFAALPAAAAPTSAMDADAKIAGGPQGDFANLDFMAEAALVATNLLIDEQGFVTVDLAMMGTHQHVHVVAVDPLNTVERSYSLPDRSPRVIDQRLAESLPSDQHFSQQKQIDVVSAGTEFKIPDVTTSRFQVYDDLESVFQLYQSLLKDPTLAEFQFILTWPELEQPRKQELYSQFACHELNFFLSQRDPDFFNKIVKPYLSNKLHKTFLDLWLLDKDLSEYLKPRNYQHLNTVEKGLLGRRIVAERDVTSRFLREQLELLPPDVVRVELLFGTAVNGRQMMLDFNLKPQDAPADGSISRETDRGRMSIDGRAAGSGVRLGAGGELMEKASERQERDLEMQKDATPLFRKEAAAADNALSESLGDNSSDKQKRTLSELFRQTEKTQEWAENNYYKRPIESQDASLVTVNAFWADFAAHGPQGAFFSSHLAEASRNFTEVMFAMSVLELPFKAGEHQQDQQGAAWKIKAATPLVIVHEQIKATAGVVKDLPILVSQNFFKHDDRYRTVNGQRQDKFVSDEFLLHTVYGCQVVLTNPTSSTRKLNLLFQVPQGAIPVLSSHYTHSQETVLESYKTSSIEYYFYFPFAGEFGHYPVNVAQAQELVTNAAPVKCKVVERPTTQDTESWDYVSQYASAAEVLRYLETHSLHQTNLSRIAWRMQDANFFTQAIAQLSMQHAFEPTVWSYGVKHNQPAAVREFLSQNEQFVQICGPVLKSLLLDIEPVERNLFEYREYRPLVNARAHQLGDGRHILNDRFRGQFANFTKILSYGRDVSDQDRLTLSGYLLLQDRVTEALSCLSQINVDNLPTRIQHDYLAAYCDFFDGELDVARTIVAKYADYPVDRWRNAFAAMAVQVKEIDEARQRGNAQELIDPNNRDQLLAQLAAGESTFEVAVDQQEVTVDFQNLETIQVNYYLMDIELLFSRNPFVQQESGNFAHIHPNLSQSIELPKKKSQFTLQLPAELRNRNVLVEVLGQGKSKRAAYYSNSLTVQTSDNYGQVRVTDEKGRKSLAGVYVKAYAKMKDGSTRFYKDGYTDLRGRFDYASLSTNDLDNVERFALLMMSEDQGAVVREVAPPAR